MESKSAKQESEKWLQIYVQKVLCSEGPIFRRFYVKKVLYLEGFMFTTSFVQKVLCLESTVDYLSVRIGHTDVFTTLIRC